MLSSLSLYLSLIRLSLRKQLSNRSELAMQIIGQGLSSAMAFVGIWLLLRQFEVSEHVNLYQFGVLFGLINISFGLAQVFGHSFDAFYSNFIVGRNIDEIILRPRAIVLQILGSDIRLRSVGRMLQGIFILLVCAPYFGAVSALTIAIMLSSIIGTFFIFLGVFVLQAALSFWLREAQELMIPFTYGSVQATQYPISIYPIWIIAFFSYFLPLQFTHYLPAATLMSSSYAVMSILVGPAVGVLFFAFSVFLFGFGLRRYMMTN